LFIFHSLFETVQYQRMFIHCDAMTKTSYLESFMTMHPTTKYWSSLKAPDYEKAKNGERDQ